MAKGSTKGAPAKLAAFEGREVLATAVKITNTGDGLSKAVQVDNVELHHKDTVHVLLECEVVDIQTPMVKDTEGIQRKHVLRAGRASIIDAEYANKILEEMDAKLLAAQGVNPIFDADGNAVEPEAD